MNTYNKPRFAILLSGQARYRKRALESILENVIKYNNCDVFGHFWVYDDTNTLQWRAIANIANERDADTNCKSKEYAKKIQEIIPFTKLKVQDQIMFPTDKYHPGTEKERVLSEFGDVEADHHFRRCNFIVQSQWYSIYEANKLRKEYEEENGFVYDGILRFRPDLFVANPLNLSTYDNSKLNVPYGEGVLDNDNVNTSILDLVAFGNGNCMDIYADFYNHQEEILINPKIDALLSAYPLGLYIKKYLGYENLTPNYFNFNHPVHNIMILPEQN